jgi:ribosomal-protein-alanine N-acetyltransferase
MSAVYKSLPELFRPMSEEDLNSVLEIENAVYQFPWSRTIFKDCLRVGYSCCVLEHEQLGLTAYGIMSTGAGESHILNLCVNPDAQGMGNGSKILHYMMDIATKRGSDTIFLEVRPSNLIARELYRNTGFNEVGMRRDYYPSQKGREDAIIMARSLVKDQTS